MSEQSLIIADKPTLPVFSIAPLAIQLRDDALALSSLIGKVESAKDNEAAVKAHIELKRISSTFEKQRKTLKEPLLEAGRQLDRIIAKELQDVEKETGRLASLTSAFQLAEQRRIREEQELQAREIARIEREKQAEIARIAREQAEREAAERKAQEDIERAAQAARDAAAKAAREATNAAQRAIAEKMAQEAAKAAEANRIERERFAAESQAKAAAEMQRINEAAQAATLAEAKPITATRTFGQVVKTDWKITVTNPYELAKFHPDCVKIEALMTPIKAALNQGIAVKGIAAEKVTTSSVRATPLTSIEV